MSQTILSQIRQLLTDRGIVFQEKEHPPTFTSEESAAARGEPLQVGAKALLLKTDDVFRLFVLAADQKMDSAAIKRELGVKKTRFATPEELQQMTGLVPGSVPPFGKPILPFDLFADTSVGTAFNRVAFNAGSLTNSIILSADDWASIAQPTRFSFGKVESGGCG